MCLTDFQEYALLILNYHRVSNLQQRQLIEPQRKRVLPVLTGLQRKLYLKMEFLKMTASLIDVTSVTA